MKKNIAIVTLAFVAVLGIGYFAFGSHANDTPTMSLSASWAYNYEDIEELSNASDLIALVKVDGVGDAYVDQDIPYTEFNVEVVTSVYNTTEGDDLTILMTGGEIDGTVAELEDDPLLQSGDEILIFCKQNTDGTYRILSGPQGRLVYNNGKLNSLTVSNPKVRAANSASNINIKNADADVLMSQIKGYVDAE